VGREGLDLPHSRPQLSAANGGDEADASQFDLSAASIGLALLQLEAKASDPEQQPGWVNRRVEQLRFLDTRAVRWRVSIDFTVPPETPSVRLGVEQFQLVPITSLPKAGLVAFDLRDEHSATLWLPTSQQTTHYIASALVFGASQELGVAPQQVPPALVHDLERIVLRLPGEFRSRPPALLAAAALIDANDNYSRAARAFENAWGELARTPLRRFWRRQNLMRRLDYAGRQLAAARATREEATERWHGIAADVRPLACRLMSSGNFRNRIEELAQNFIVHVGVQDPCGARRVIKLGYEGQVTFARPRGRLRRLWQSMGWRCWQVAVLAGGRGGSYHLEVAAPPGVDVVGITADPLRADETAPEIRRWRRLAASARPLLSSAWWRRLFRWKPVAAVAVAGYLPHVHINPPDGACVRYRAAIFIRVSRPGWLTASWLAALVIGSVMTVGRLNLSAVYAKGQSGEAGTAAILLLALLGVFATMLVRPGGHPLAARLLMLARFLIVIDAVVVLLGVGNLVLHRVQHPAPVTLWTWLAIVADGVAVLFTISWAVPVARLPHRE
jgi:hypothetical protein